MTSGYTTHDGPPGFGRVTSWARRPFAFLALALLLASCAGRLRPDPSPAAALSNYPSAEFYACGRHFVGLGYCELPVGTPINSIAFAVQGYHAGRIRVFSAALPIDVSLRYAGTKRVPITLPGIPRASVALGFTVNPEFPDEESQGVEVYGTMGWLLVKVALPGEAWTFSETRSPVGSDAVVRIPSAGASSAIVISPECGVDRTVPIAGEELELRLGDLVDASEMGRCIFQVGLLGTGRFHAWLAWRYAPEFIPLASPALDRGNDSVRVTADATVSALILDDEMRVDREAKFKIDWARPHVLRAVTVKGRSAVGVWNPENQEVLWMR